MCCPCMLFCQTQLRRSLVVWMGALVYIGSEYIFRISFFQSKRYYYYLCALNLSPFNYHSIAPGDLLTIYC